MYFDDSIIVIYFLLFGCFSLIWNMFAVLGIIFTIKFFVTRRKNSKSTDEVKKEKVTAKNVDSKVVKEVSQETPKKEISKETPKRSSFNKKYQAPDNSSILLYTGAFLVGFSVLLFVLYNWESYTNNIKTLLIVTIVLLFYALTYLFSLWPQYKKVSNTFLFLATLSLGFAGIGIWKFYIQENLFSIRFVDFWFIYSLFLMVAYLLTYELSKKKVYFILSLVMIYLALIFGTKAIVSDVKYQIAFLIAGNIALLGSMLFIQKGKHLFDKIGIPVARTVGIFLNIINFLLIYDSMGSLDTIEDRLFAIVTLFIPLLTIYLLQIKKKDLLPELLVEGVLLLPKLFISATILSANTDVYHFLAISIITFLIVVAMSFKKKFNSRDWRALLVPLTITSTLSMLVLPFIPPVSRIQPEPFAIAISFLIISIAIQAKSLNTGRWWMRFFNIPLDLFAFIAFVIGIENRLEVGLSELYIVGILLLIPSTIYLTEWVLSEGSRRRALLVGSIFFLVLGTLMTFLDYDEPVFLFSISAVGVAYFFLLLYLTRWKYFAIPIVLFSYLNTFAATVYFEWEFTLMVFLMILMSFFFGNIWRIKPYLSTGGVLMDETFKLLKTLSALSIVPLTLFTLIQVFEFDNLLVPLSALLISAYIYITFGTHKVLKYTSGIGLVLLFWYLIQRSDTPIYANAQIYAFPIVIYSLILTYVLYPIKPALSRAFLVISFLLPMSIALMQSIADPVPYGLFHGMLLLVVSTALLVYGVIKQDKLLIVISIVYIAIELLIQLWDVILSIPWWVYVGLLGMAMISISVWIIYKVARKQEVSDVKKPSPQK